MSPLDSKNPLVPYNHGCHTTDIVFLCASVIDVVVEVRPEENLSLRHVSRCVEMKKTLRVFGDLTVSSEVLSCVHSEVERKLCNASARLEDPQLISLGLLSECVGRRRCTHTHTRNFSRARGFVKASPVSLVQAPTGRNSLQAAAPQTHLPGRMCSRADRPRRNCTSVASSATMLLPEGLTEPRLWPLFSLTCMMAWQRNRRIPCPEHET